ncbi:oxidoreductase [Glutamicibacter sp. BW80]|uniref:molybdopterin-dependent oxidoreductase n=1 Tax=Glutamicibacter sp. BW80 TaxID=2024404 RepID=UPI000BB97BBA|nr:molybdopterin-dependent oxidoreductase [Glutamicibacter sp. BW80]PCC27523.1 oxidoreductase [Glutamicibacter sp. BW80]
MDDSRGQKRSGLLAYGFAGLVSAAVLFAVAQLVSVFFATSSAPGVALGSTFIDFTPPWLKDFAIATFGTNDKLALFISIGIVATILAALVGLLARRSFAAAAAAILVLAAVIGAAVITRSATGPMDLVPVVVGTLLGLGTLKWLTGLATTSFAPASEEETSPGPSRRKFLLASSLSLLGALVVAGVGASISATRNAAEAARLALGLPAAKVKAGKVPAGAQVDLAGMPKFVTPNEDFYRIDTALSVPRLDPAEWSLRVHGMVENEFTMSFDELLGQDLVESYLTLTCVSNPVGGDLVGNAKWLGYPLRNLIERAGPQAGADMVLSTSSDGFSASTPIEVLTDDRMALLAVGMNDEPLPLEHGFPVRMVVPGLYGYVSATKWVVDLEVTRFADKEAYWTTRGWSDRGPIKMSSRVDVPRSFTQLPPGEVVMGGTAWAQTTGISKVEVKIDDEPWQEAELAVEATLDTWRQWRYVWKGGTPGNHSVTVRAYDAAGEMQTSERADPVPNGASGWQRVQFSVTDS